MGARARRRLIGVGVGVFLVLGFGQFAVDVYAEAAWFGALGYTRRFWTLALARGAAWVGVAGVSALVLYFVLWDVLRRSGPMQVRRRFGDLEIAEAIPGRWARIAVLSVSILAALLVAAPTAAALGERLLFAFRARPWGEADAILGRDARFYIFVVPALRVAWSITLSLVLWATIAVTSILVLSGRIAAEPNAIRVDALARTWLSRLGVAVLLVVAGHFALSAFEIVGAGPITYSDVYGSIPARRLLAILALLGAAAVGVAGRTGRWRLALVSVGIVAVVWPLGTAIYPGLIHRFRVEPNELALERPFIQANVNATRSAFGLDGIEEKEYATEETPPSAEKLRRWTAGLPLWDERPLRATYNQLQGLLAYHEFPDVDNDRYGAVGAQEQVAIAVREFSPARLAASARTWLNLHLRYTHGQGVVLSPVDRVRSGGEPEYYVRDLPPVPAPGAPAGLDLSESRVFFGELSSAYALVVPDSLAEGLRPAGVDLGGLTRRLAFAWALRSKNILLRGGSSASLLLWRRQVVSRVRAIVPFLLVDPDPAPVIDEGRVKWIVDVYAAARRYPLSEPALVRGQRVNYLRDGAKAIVDGVTGRVTLYLIDADDPLLATYDRSFPGLFRRMSDMSPSLRSHIRYPRALLRAQAEVLEAYHLKEPEEFYNKQDLWSLAKEVYQDRPVPVEPYYLLMPFPGEAGGSSEFLLTLPFTPRNRDNLAAFLIARNDGDAYGELSLYRIAAVRQVFGPRQVEVQIDQDPAISQQLSLWRQLGSRATRGHLLLVPVEGFLLYVEPLFLEAEDREGAAPGLKRVIASAGDRVAMSETLEGALGSLLEERVQTPAMPGQAAPGPGQTEDLGSLVRNADAALRKGDLRAFAEMWERIRRAVGDSEDGGREGARPPANGEGG
ncbi:MAG: UPF0182 family protein [Gemmatimonadota bacterium]